jgi:L-threonylcarbamoyladenylate synthase
LPDPGKIIGIDPVTPEPKAIAKAGNIIQKGGVVVFPTQCLYGIAADALNEKAVEKVFNIKKRPTDNPILVLVPDQSFLQDLAESIPEPAKKLMKAFWPGGLTLVCRAKPTVPKRLTAGSGKLGIRVPAHPAAKALVDFLGFPITGTSANISGEPGCDRISLLDPSIFEASDLILDAGILKGGIGSTIVDVTVFPIRIIREGMISEHQIRRILAD